jgi:hypothetical protein
MTQTMLNKTNVDKLETEIRALIEPERQSFMTIFAEGIEHQIDYFLASRRPNQTLEEFYRNFGMPEGVRESLVMDPEGVRNRHIQKDRPAFPYHRHEQADEIIRRISERNADDVLAAFINRVMHKLSPVVARKGDFTVAKTTDSLSRFERARGCWEGVLSLVFEDGTKFSARLTIITNFTKFGKPFGQYPMRFFDCVLVPHDEHTIVESGAASIEEIWASVGYVLPPPTKKPRWAKVVSGSVLLANGTHHLVSSPGKLKKLGLVDYEQVARIEVQSYGARVEYQDGMVKRYEFTEDEKAQVEALERAYKYNKATEKRRELVFQGLFGEVTA